MSKSTQTGKFNLEYKKKKSNFLLNDSEFMKKMAEEAKIFLYIIEACE